MCALAQSSKTGFRASTGYGPIDSVRYEEETKVDAYRHHDSDILLFRTAHLSRRGEMTTASRGTWDPDLIMLSRGTGATAFGKVAGSPFTAAPSTALRTTFVPRGVDSDVTFAMGARSSNLMFPKGYLAGLVADGVGRELQPSVFQEDPQLVRLIQMLEAEMMAPGFASGLLVEGISRSIAILLMRVDHRVIVDQADRIHLSPMKLRRILEYIDGNLDQDLRLSEMAAIAELSTFHFSRVFKLATGYSPYRFVRDRRLDRSRALLRDGQLDIAELAVACGFATQSHFTAAFTKAIGIPPGRFRRNAQGQTDE